MRKYLTVKIEKDFYRQEIKKSKIFHRLKTFIVMHSKFILIMAIIIPF